MATKKKDEAKEKQSDAEASGEVDESKLSYGEIAALSDAPVITTTRLIEAFPPKEPTEPKPKPNTVIKTEVIWGPLPKEPPPKPDRAAATVKTHVMERAGAPAKRPPSIGSMQIPGGKK